MLSWRYATLHYSTQGVLSAASRGYGGGPLYQSGLCFTIEAMLGEGDKVLLSTEAPAPPCNKQTASRDLKALSDEAAPFPEIGNVDANAIVAGLQKLERDPALFAALQHRALQLRQDEKA